MYVCSLITFLKSIIDLSDESNKVSEFALLLKLRLELTRTKKWVTELIGKKLWSEEKLFYLLSSRNEYPNCPILLYIVGELAGWGLWLFTLVTCDIVTRDAWHLISDTCHLTHEKWHKFLKVISNNSLKLYLKCVNLYLTFFDIGATICTRPEIQCLPYEDFFVNYAIQCKIHFGFTFLASIIWQYFKGFGGRQLLLNNIVNPDLFL